MTQLINDMIDNIDKKIGNKPFYSTRELVDCGIFGSLAGARKALRSGHLIYVKISQRRFVVVRHDLLNFLKKNFENKAGHKIYD